MPFWAKLPRKDGDGMDPKDKQIQYLTALVETLNATIKELQETVKGSQETIKALEETIKELRRQLGQDSHNSSKPPSSDGYKKPPRTRSQRTPSGKKPGGQKGHKGANMSIPHAPDEFRSHFPEKCLTCPHLSECLENKSVFKCGEKRYTVEAEVITKVIEHRSLKVDSCPCGETPGADAFPENVKAYVQYGSSVTVLVGLLSTYGAMSAMRIHTLIGGLLGVCLSPGTVVSMVRKCAKKVGPIMKMIKELIENGDVGHFDETGARLGGGLYWVHNSSTSKYTYQTISKKRGKVGIDANGVLPNFHGVAMHDCWSPYWKYDGLLHAICNAHLLRELTGIEDFEPDHTWAFSFKALLRAMKKAKDRAVAKGKSGLSPSYLAKFSREYDLIMAVAEEECPEPPDLPRKKRGKKKKGKERALIERLIKLKDAVCLFIRDFKVPFDNNQAERDVRNVKTKVKVAGCFRSEGGAQNYLDVMSFLSTGMKHQISVFDVLTAAFADNAEIVLQ